MLITEINKILYSLKKKKIKERMFIFSRYGFYLKNSHFTKCSFYLSITKHEKCTITSLIKEYLIYEK
jgi:hypothetical protein